jgi:hypothetical protein
MAFAKLPNSYNEQKALLLVSLSLHKKEPTPITLQHSCALRYSTSLSIARQQKLRATLKLYIESAKRYKLSDLYFKVKQE